MSLLFLVDADIYLFIWEGSGGIVFRDPLATSLVPIMTCLLYPCVCVYLIAHGLAFRPVMQAMLCYYLNWSSQREGYNDYCHVSL